MSSSPAALVDLRNTRHRPPPWCRCVLSPLEPVAWGTSDGDDDDGEAPFPFSFCVSLFPRICGHHAPSLQWWRPSLAPGWPDPPSPWPDLSILQPDPAFPQWLLCSRSSGGGRHPYDACPPVARDRNAHWDSAWLAWVAVASPIYPSRGDGRPSRCGFLGVVARALSTVTAPLASLLSYLLGGVGDVFQWLRVW